MKPYMKPTIDLIELRTEEKIGGDEEAPGKLEIGERQNLPEESRFLVGHKKRGQGEDDGEQNN